MGIGACGDPGVYTRGLDVGKTPSDGTGGAFDAGAGGTFGSGGMNGAGGFVAGGGVPGHGGGVSPTGGASGAAAVGGVANMASGSGGTLASGGSTGTGGRGGLGGRGGNVASGGSLGTGGGAGGKPGSGGTVATGGVQGTGGITVATGGTVGTAGGSGGGWMAGAPGAGGVGDAPTDPAKLNFETSSQNWGVDQGTFAKLGRSTVRHFAGASSLSATLQYTASSAAVTNTLAVGDVAPNSPPGPGSVITFHVYLPATAPAIEWVQPFLMDSSFAFFGAFTGRDALTFGGWNTLKVTLPATALPTLHLLGVEIRTSGSTSLSDDVFIDSVDW